MKRVADALLAALALATGGGLLIFFSFLSGRIVSLQRTRSDLETKVEYIKSTNQKLQKEVELVREERKNLYDRVLTEQVEIRKEVARLRNQNERMVREVDEAKAGRVEIYKQIIAEIKKCNDLIQKGASHGSKVN